MGNVVKRRSRDFDNYSTPEIPELTFDEVEIIQRTWKIPAIKVSGIRSYFKRIGNGNFKFFFLYSNMIQQRGFFTSIWRNFQQINKFFRRSGIRLC